jgi:beta-carotene ketolase (CrtW type)
LIAGSIWSVLVFFAVPGWLSALQLFVFGTYLPHRTPHGGHTDPHNARSNPYPVWLSFLTCYHFGYHEEHHHHPRVPWWRLPQLRRAVLDQRRGNDAMQQVRASAVQMHERVQQSRGM